MTNLFGHGQPATLGKGSGNNEQADCQSLGPHTGLDNLLRMGLVSGKDTNIETSPIRGDGQNLTFDGR